jgi:hypothetical protein
MLSDPPDPGRIAANTRALLQRGEVKAPAAIAGLVVIFSELREAGFSEETLAPIIDLLAELRANDQ